jgi:hypothetical protein
MVWKNKNKERKIRGMVRDLRFCLETRKAIGETV